MVIEIRHLKLYLLSLYALIHLISFYDERGIPYFPIELSSLLATHYTRKSIFLAALVPITLFLCFSKSMPWPGQGIGLSLFLMVLFDVGNEWFLHLLAVAIFGLSINAILTTAYTRRLFGYIVLCYLSRLLLKTLFIWCYEMAPTSNSSNTSLIVKIKVLSALGCSGYNQCALPSMTTYLFQFCALLQWAIFILLSLIMPEQEELLIMIHAHSKE